MSCTTALPVTANKQHRCTWCGESIESGSTYMRWISFGLPGDGVFTNKMHAACMAACDEQATEWGDSEYTPYSNDRPERLSV